MHHKTNNDELAIYAVVAIAALAIGFFLAMNFGPQLQGGNTAISNATLQNKTGEVQIPSEKLDKLKKALEIFFGLQSKQNLTLAYKGYADNGQYLVLNFTLADGTQIPEMIVSRDLAYFYGDTRSVLKIDDLYTQAQLALAQSQQQSQQQEVVKTEKPAMEVFVMSYCPYGVQMEKAVIPVQELLGNKSDISIKFVNYVLHGSKETQENTRQYCIMQNYSDKYWNYLKCFAGNGNASACMANSGISETSINACMAETYSKYGISDSGSAYPIYAAENQKYGVQGSPAVVINGVAVDVSRSPEEVKKALCSAFITPPAECSTNLSTAQASSGFGYGTGTASSSGGCGA